MYNSGKMHDGGNEIWGLLIMKQKVVTKFLYDTTALSLIIAAIDYYERV